MRTRDTGQIMPLSTQVKTLFGSDYCILCDQDARYLCPRCGNQLCTTHRKGQTCEIPERFFVGTANRFMRMARHQLDPSVFALILSQAGKQE